jgi:16S rRNA processing protein RimM
MEKNGFLQMAKIVGVHGVKGTVKVHSYAEDISAFNPGDSVFFKLLTGEIKTYTIEWVKPHQRRLLIGFTEINNRDQAEKLVGSELLMNRADLPEPEEGTYYWDDIIGLTVFTVHNETLGRVTSIIQTGSNDVYVVKRSDEDDSVETLIPALESVVVAIDLEKKTMRVDLPEGL